MAYAEFDCPKCGGPVYDNRHDKKNPKAPDFKCKDRNDCGWSKWEDRGRNGGGNRGGGNRSNGNGGGNRTAGPSRPQRPLGPLYYQCMKVAQKTVADIIGESATAADIIAATATLFIGAHQTGAVVVVPKAKPAPEPEPEPEDDGFRDDARWAWDEL